MGIADFFRPEPTEPRETVGREELDELRESADSYRMLRRELEDVGYYLLNAKIGDIDLKPIQRERFYRRTLKYYLEDPIVMRAVDMQPHYVFGRGLPRPESNNPLVQQAIDKFWDDEDNKLSLTTFKAQFARAVELQLQANIYFVIFETDEGVKVGTLPHEEIVDVVTDPENRLRPVWYKRQYQEQTYDFVVGAYKPDAEPKTIWYQDWKHEPPRGFKPPPTKDGQNKIAKGKIFHVKVGSTGEMKFGVPPVQRILDWAKAHNEWMRARVAVAKAAAQFAWERKLKTGSDPNRVMAMARDWASAKHQSVTGATGEWGDEDPMSSPRYASMLTTNEGVEYVFKGGNSTGAGDASSDQKMFRSQISAGTGLPQHFLGDEGSANLATATAMNEPVIRMMEFVQEMWEDVYRQIMDRHLEVLNLSNRANPFSIEFESITEAESWQDTPGDEGILDRQQEKDKQSAKFKISDGVIIDATEPMDNNKPVYKLAFPPILNRDVASMLGLVIDSVTGLDPAGDNTDLTRWAFKEILKVMGEVDPDKIVDSIFPSSSMADAATTNEEKAAVKGDIADPAVSGMPTAMPPEMMPVGMGPAPAGTSTGAQPFPNGHAPGRKAANLNTPGGMGYSMDGAQNGARMGNSLQEAEIDYSDIEKVWRQIESDLLEMVNEKVE
jgi:hypothetical protein